MSLKKMSMVTCVVASILSGTAVVSASPYLNVYSRSISINEDASASVIEEAKSKFEAAKGKLAESSLTLSQVPIEQAIEAINSFKEVKEINLRSIPLKDLEFLKGLPNLEKINLYLSYNDDSEPLDISALTNNLKLTNFYATSAKIKDLAPLSTCTNLAKLDIYMCKIANNTISPLKTLLNLQELSLYGTNVDDFAHLSPLTKLKKINVYATKPNDGATLDYNRLSEIKSLENINAGLTKEMTSVAFLKDLPNIKSIEFLGEKIDDLETLENAKSLEYIMFWGHSFDLDANKIGKAKSLKRLKFWSTEGVINWEGLSNLSELEELTIDGVKNSNSADNPIDASFFLSLPKLKKLTLRNVELKNLNKFNSALKNLSLEKINSKSGNPLDVSAVSAPEVTKLEIVETKVVNFEKMLPSCPMLNNLVLRKIEGIKSYNFLKDLPERFSLTLYKGAITEEFKKELKDSKKMYINMW